MLADNDTKPAAASTAKTTEGYGGKISKKRSRSHSDNSGEENSKPQALPRSKAKPPAPKRKPRGREFSQPRGVLLESLSPGDKQKFIDADRRRKEDDMKIINAHSHLVDARSHLRRIQSEVDEAQKDYDTATSLLHERSHKDADTLLLYSNDWNNRYHQLKAYFEREGHSHIETLDDAGNEVTSGDSSEARALAEWACEQRRLRMSDRLEQYKVVLLNRLEFDWCSRSETPEKWLKNYNLLKEFKELHDDLEVPVQYGNDDLGLWLEKQRNLYRNGKEGKLPALSAERIRILEELGLTWKGERRKVIPWHQQYQALLEYNRNHGNVHVPWQCHENVGLAQWVNTQRKKYKGLQAGRENSLTVDQIHALNLIGFKWSFGGNGCDSTEPPDEEQSSRKEGTNNVTPFSKPNSDVAGLTGLNGMPSNTFPAVFASTEAEAANTAASSGASMMAANNLQPRFAQVNQTQNGMFASLSNNTNEHFMGSLYPDGFGTNQHNVLGSLGTNQQVYNTPQALQSNDLSTLPVQTWQHVLNPQFIQPQNNNGIGGPPPFQQMLSTQPFLMQPSSYNMMNAPPLASQSANSHSLSQAYGHLFNQQINQLPNSNFGVLQASQNSFADTYKQLPNQQTRQNPNMAIGTTMQASSQAPAQDGLSVMAGANQQLLTQQTHQLSANPNAGYKPEHQGS